MSYIKALVPVFLMFSVSSFAQTAPQPTNVANTQFSESDQSNAMTQQVWSLTDEEMVTYQQLIEKERAFTDVDALSPYEILGKHANTEHEKKRYAKLFVKSMVNNHIKALEWSILVSNEVNDSDPANNLFASNLVNEYLQEIGYKKKGASNDFISPIETKSRLAFYTDATCNDCDMGQVTQLMKMVKGGRFNGIDVVFVGMGSPDQKLATSWAVAQGITADMVNKKQITLNFESGTYKIKRKGRETPLVLDTSNGRTIEILK